MCSYVGYAAFSSCPSLTEVNLPMCEYISEFTFQGCTSLTSVNLPMCSYVGKRLFQGLQQNITLYVGTSLSTVCELAGDFTGIFSGDVPELNGSIFVPMSLIDAYKSAQNWSGYASKIFGI
jgi:hypothetical protein